MIFNADKCKCLHVGHSYPSVSSIGGVQMKNVKANKVLGVITGYTLDFSLLCAKVVSTANEVSSRVIVCIRVKATSCICKSRMQGHI